MSGRPSSAAEAPPIEMSRARSIFERPAPRAESHDSASWLLTFTDLVALLLAFFVMLFAMSKVDLRKWQNLTEALARGLNSVRQESAVAPHHSLDIHMAELTSGQDLDYLAGILSERLSGTPTAAPPAAVEIRRFADRLVVSLPVAAVDAGRGAAVKNGILFELAGVLRQVRNRIEVVGYAGADETADKRASPWELALRRAIGAAEGLRASGYRRDVILQGRLWEEPLTREPAGPRAERKSAAARIDFVVRFDAVEEP